MTHRKKTSIILLVALLSIGVSLLLTSWSERCYFCIPPVALAVFVTNTENWQDRIRPGITIALGGFGLALGLAFLVIGPAAVLSARFCLEVATALYFLTAVVLVLMMIRRAVLACSLALYERWKLPPYLRLLWCELLPLVILVGFALPYALALSNVHRFKVPNLADPKVVLDREFEEVEFRSADGTRLRGWWIPARTPSDTTLVLCHGVAGNRSQVLPFVEVGDWLDANVLVFDFRGHGDSGGHAVTFGYREKDDVLAALEFARREKQEQSRLVFGMGISMGAACMARAAAEVDPPLQGVILDSSFTSTRDMTQNAVQAFPACCHPWLLTLGVPLADWHAGCAMSSVNIEASIERISSTVIFLHSQGDPVIPSEHSIRLQKHVRYRSRLCIFPIDGHCNAFFVDRERYRRQITFSRS